MTASDHLKDFQHEEDCPCFGNVVEHSIDCKLLQVRAELEELWQQFRVAKRKLEEVENERR